MDASIAKELKGLRKQWKKAKPQQPGFSPLEDGRCTGKLTKMEIGKSKSGRLQCVWTFSIMDGPNKGKTAKIFDGLEDDTNISYFKGRCEIVGLEIPDDPTELESAFEEFVDGNEDLFTLDIKTKGEYQNVYIAGVSDLEESGDEDEEDEESDEDEEDTDDEDEDGEVDKDEDEEEEKPKKRKTEEQEKAKGGKKTTGKKTKGRR